MKTKHYFLIAAVGMFTLAAGSAFAFHGGGVAHCDGCHSMHNSADNPVAGTANGLLLKGSDLSSTCLNCHSGAGGYHINSTGGSNTNAGGDFFWMNTDYNVIVRGNTVTVYGENAGHNVVAADFGMVADGTNTTAPGGTYPSASLSCSSCHDAHGQVDGGTGAGTAAISGSGSYGAAEPTDGSILGNYRLLGDTAYIPPGQATPFTNGAPIARALNVSGGSYGGDVDYGSGMSEWCANCHPQFLVGSSTAYKHPSGNDVHLNGVNVFAANYNSYKASGDFTNTQATAYDPLVPIERGVTTGAWDLDVASTFGADGSSNIMCLTCHRAHGSANQNAGRWDFETEFIAESAALEAIDLDQAVIAPYYGDGAKIDVVATYGSHQRSLCNKCHVQD